MPQTASAATRTPTPSTTSRHGPASASRSRQARTSSGAAHTTAVSSHIRCPGRPVVTDDAPIPAAAKATSTRFVVCTHASRQ